MSLWTYDPKTEWLCYAGIRIGCVEPENGAFVARACNSHDELVAACEALVSAGRDCRNWRDMIERQQAATLRIEEALAKAKGKP